MIKPNTLEATIFNYIVDWSDHNDNPFTIKELTDKIIKRIIRAVRKHDLAKLEKIANPSNIHPTVQRIELYDIRKYYEGSNGK